jgi:hypothetical protein
MSTTLLLAYSAEYTAMIMTFIAQGIPFENAINMIWLSSEVIHAPAGSFWGERGRRRVVKRQGKASRLLLKVFVIILFYIYIHPCNAPWILT